MIVIKKRGYNLHILPTKKFKNIEISIFFRQKAIKKEVTSSKLLKLLLTDSTKDYPNNHLMNHALEKMYGARLTSEYFFNGISSITEMTINGLHDDYSDDGMIESYIKFLSEIIFQPNLTTENLNYQKDYLKNIQLSLISDMEYQSKTKAIKLVTDGVLSFNKYGYLEELEKITINDIKKSYYKLINNSLIDIYIAGNLEENKTTELVAKYFSEFKNNKSKNLSINYDDSIKEVDELETIEQEDLFQSKLKCIYKISDISEDERHYYLPVLNLLLAGNGNVSAKLPKLIREKNSLCYYINADYYRLNNILIIEAGIDGNNKDRVVELIRQTLNNIKEKRITAKEVNSAKEQLLNDIRADHDYLSRLIYSNYYDYINYQENIDIVTNKINQINSYDMAKLIDKLELIKIYMLGGEEK